MRERYIYKEVIINAEPDEVWLAWTTENGIKSFFAPECNIDIRPEGEFEILFNPDAPSGEKGGEGLKVLAVQHRQMLSFTWNAPPHLSEVRDQRTIVVLRFCPHPTGTKVTLFHGGWGTGGQWDEAYDYFVRAWSDIVLPRLKYRFVKGAVDWANPPGPDVLKNLK